MRSRMQRIALVVVMVLGIFPATIGSALAERTIDGEFPIAVAPYGQTQPDIDWPYVVYKDGRNAHGGDIEKLERETSPDIRIYNMETGQDFAINPGDWQQANPSISGKKVVYSDQRNYDETECDIWMYDIATGKETQLTDAPGGQGNPFIHGDIVAWVDWRAQYENGLGPEDIEAQNGAYSAIWMKDLVSGEETAVAPGAGNQREPVVWEDYIVWKDDRHGNSSIFLYDISSDEATCIAEGWYAESHPYEYAYYSDPFVYDGIVVFASYESLYIEGSWTYQQSILMYDIATGETTTISTETEDSRWHPVTRDGWVTWTDTRNEGWKEVWGYNLETEEETVLVEAEWAEMNGFEANGEPEWFKYAGRSTVGDGWVIWHDHRPWDGDDDHADLYAKFLGEGSAPTQKMPLQGATRYQTAIEVSRQTFPDGADTVVIATGLNWPDALAGSTLAGVMNAPILLVDDAYPVMTGAEGYVLAEDIAEEIERLGVSYAYILGGEEAVSAEVELALQSQFEMDTERLGGVDRFETACLIAEEAVWYMGEGWDGTAFVTTGFNFPDALAAAPLAGWAGYPVFLSTDTGLSSATQECMDELGVDGAIVLGGTVAVPMNALDQLEALAVEVDRIGGDDRYETAAKIAEYGVGEFGMSMDTLGISTGVNFPDALTTGAALGQDGYVMMLVAQSRLPQPTALALDMWADEISQIRYAGGPVAIAQSVRDAIAAIVY